MTLVTLLCRALNMVINTIMWPMALMVMIYIVGIVGLCMSMMNVYIS